MSKKIGFSDLIRNFCRVNPKEVESMNNLAYMENRNYLYSLIYSIYNFKGIPATWDLDYLRDVLFQEGHGTIINTSVGIQFFRCGYSGINMHEKPTHVVVSNPVLGQINGTINDDCVLLYCLCVNNAYLNFEPVVQKYALMLAQIDASINVNLINTRIPFVFTGDKETLKSMQAAYDKITEGSPALFMAMDNSEVPVAQTWFNNTKNQFIAQDLYNFKRSIICEFLTRIGVANVNITKKERLITDEADGNNGETNCMISLTLNNINRCFDNARMVFENAYEVAGLKVEYNQEILRGFKNELAKYNQLQ